MYRSISLFGLVAGIRDFSSGIATKWKIAAALLFASLMFVPAPASAEIFTYECNPDSFHWVTEGAWSGGTVLESRTCLQHDTVANKVRVLGEFRTRNGTTAVISDWNLTDTVAYVWKYNPGPLDAIGNKSNHEDIFDKSYIQVKSNWSCIEAGSLNIGYNGMIKDVQANPNGTTLGASGFKDTNTNEALDNRIDC